MNAFRILPLAVALTVLLSACDRGSAPDAGGGIVTGPEKPFVFVPPVKAPVGYKSVEDAWTDLTVNQATKVVRIGLPGGLRGPASDPAARPAPERLADLKQQVTLFGPTQGVSWLFVSSKHPAFPAVARRAFGRKGDPVLNTFLCQGPADACARWEAELNTMSSNPPKARPPSPAAPSSVAPAPAS